MFDRLLTAAPDRCGSDRPDPGSNGERAEVSRNDVGSAGRESQARRTCTRSGARMMASRDSRATEQPIIKVLIAHSDPLISAGLSATLRKRRDFKVAICNPESSASHSTVSHFPAPDVVVADYDSGLRLTALKSASTDRVMILTHNHSETKISHALEQGVRGYLLLGCSLEDLTQGIRSMHLGGIALDPLVASRIAERMKQEALTRREEDILGQIMLGLSNKGIASKLTLAVGTVKTHVKSILRKLDAASRTEAVAIAQRRGILGDSGRGAQMAARFESGRANFRNTYGTPAAELQLADRA
jgi:DNA-binding NarL/FixJ family response regulator